MPAPENSAPSPSPPRDGLGRRVFRLLFGRRLKTAEAASQKVGPWQAVPILGLGALSSAAYGPEAILTVLMPLGGAGLDHVRGVIAAVLVLLAILFFSYRQVTAAYPDEGGAYSVARKNLGKGAGLTAAAALLLDYALNVAVGIAAGVGVLVSVFPGLQAHTLPACLTILALVTLVNLRGVRDSGLAWTIPTYAFVISLLIILVIGLSKAGLHGGAIAPGPGPPAATEPVGAWLLLRAFAVGCTSITGVEAVSNGMTIFGEPRVRKARRTLALICSILALLLAGIGFLAHAFRLTALPPEDPGYQSLLSQLASAVVGRGGFYYVIMGSVLAVLTLSANTSFAAFPRLCRLLAEDSYLPASFAALGRRLVYPLGIGILALVSGTLLLLFRGVTDHLIPLFAIGAFGAFTLSQAGMVAHWWREGRRWASPFLLINALGAAITAMALIVIAIAEFADGAWITLAVIAGLIAVFTRVRRHYAHVKREIRPPLELQTSRVRPLKVVIPIDGWNKVTERALRVGLKISDDLTAVHITPQEENAELAELWRTRVQEPARQAGFAEPQLAIVHSPYRTLFQPFLDYLGDLHRQDPDRSIAVIVPELVQPRWWEYLLHNHLAAGLKAALLWQGDERTIVLNTPWYLRENPPRGEVPAGDGGGSGCTAGADRVRLDQGPA